MPIINPNPNLNAITYSKGYGIPAVDIVYKSRGNKTANINVKKIMNGDITLEAGWQWQNAAKVISPFIIFAFFDVSFRHYNL